MTSDAAPFSVQSVAEGVYACVPPDGTANAGFIVGEDGIVGGGQADRLPPGVQRIYQELNGELD